MDRLWFPGFSWKFFENDIRLEEIILISVLWDIIREAGEHTLLHVESRIDETWEFQSLECFNYRSFVV